MMCWRSDVEKEVQHEEDEGEERGKEELERRWSE